MDRLQQVLHWFHVPIYNIYIYISTYFNILSLYFNNFQFFLKKNIGVEHYKIFSNQLLIFQPISGLKSVEIDKKCIISLKNEKINVK